MGIKVLHIFSSNRFSGAENVGTQIIKMFDTDQDIQMAYTSPNGNISDILKEYQIEFIPMSKLGVREIQRVVNQYKPDLIHAHDMRATFYSSIANCGLPIISHIHNNSFKSRDLSLKSIAFFLCKSKINHVIWVSKSAFNGYYFNRFYKKKSTILYNVIDIKNIEKRVLDGKDPFKFDVVFLGRLSVPKNPIRLLNVFNELVRILPTVRIGIVGTGELELKVKQLSNELGLDKNIKFTGFISNPMRILKNSKVMVMTSLWEGTPMCALESLALGTPIVATPVDGLKDLIVDDVNGYLDNSDTKIAQRIAEIVSDESIYNRLSENAIIHAADFNNISNYKSEIKKIYSNALQS